MKTEFMIYIIAKENLSDMHSEQYRYYLGFQHGTGLDCYYDIRSCISTPSGIVELKPIEGLIPDYKRRKFKKILNNIDYNENTTALLNKALEEPNDLLKGLFDCPNCGTVGEILLVTLPTEYGRKQYKYFCNCYTSLGVYGIKVNPNEFKNGPTIDDAKLGWNRYVSGILQERKAKELAKT